MSDDSGKIAIIGMSGAFPGSADLDEFWDKLCLGKEMIRFCGSAQPDEPGAAFRKGQWVPAVSCMDGIDLFDAAFFGITPHEAEITDPQHRILLEHSWRAIEHAGYDSRRYKGATGVFAGATINTYLLQNIASRPDWMRSLDPVKVNIGNGADFLTSRISYKLNLHGPSHAVQSACSTSLVAVHCACRSLLDFECDMALAGGVSINVTLLEGYRYQEGGIVSPDGHCRAFDARAQGTVFGSGVGVVVLKRLEDAVADGDCIHAVVRGSAVNNDGAQKVGYTAPSVDGQAEVIVEALASAGLRPEGISYVECHGTGTPLGDPVEVRALSKAFGQGIIHSCALGSVKSNVGHLDAAAGVTGLIKTVLCLKHKMLPPSLHFHEPNPQIDFSGTPFYVNTMLSPWKSDGGPLRAGVSAFGVGGTNAHVVLEEAPDAVRMHRARTWQLLPLSARTESALKHMALNVAGHLRKHPELDLEDIAYTLQAGRQRFAHRHTVVCHNHQEAIELLEQSSGTAGEEEADGEEMGRPVVFLFPGQGAQHAAMGRELYQEEPVFREHLDRCSEILRAHLGLDLNRLLRGELAGAEQIDQTWLAQPALLAVEYALAQMWMSWGIQPQALLGHSLGEYTAACVAGVMTLEEVLRLVSVRGRLMQQCQPGGMIAISLPVMHVESLLTGGLAVAASNAPDLCTVAGGLEAIAALEQRLQAQGARCQRLRTSHAFHCELVEPVQPAFLEEVRKIKLSRPKVPLISNVTGVWLTDEEAQDAGYWVKQMRASVCFDAGMREILKDAGRILLEVGPGQTLRRLGLRQPESRQGRLLLASLPAGVNAGSAEGQAVMASLGQMWEAGVVVDWKGFHHQKRQRVPLPTYPFERHRYWIDPVPLSGTTGTAGSEAEPPMQGQRKAESRKITRPPLRNPYVAPQSGPERIIVSILEKTLGVYPVGATDKFGELGGDSLSASSIVAEINAALKCDLRVIDLFEGLTARELILLMADDAVLNEAEINDQRREHRLRRRQYYNDRSETRKVPDDGA